MKPSNNTTHLPTTQPTTSMKKKIASLTGLAAFGLFAAPAIAAPLVYEGFDYALANNTSMNGVTSAATGLTGNYGFAPTVTGAGTSSSLFKSTGLTFSSNYFATVGGALNPSTFGGTAADTGISITGVNVDINATITGSLYSSYLVNITSFGASTNGSSGVRVNTGATVGGGTSNFGSYADDGGTTNGRPGAQYDVPPASIFGGPATLSAGTTYLVINLYTNVGTALSAGTPGVATSWYLTSAQYDNWLSLGGGLEANLDTYATIKVSDGPVTSGTYNFNDTKYVQFTSFSGVSGGSNGTESVVYDELRYGTTLADVALVPEPSSVLLLTLGGCLILWKKRSNRGPSV